MGSTWAVYDANDVKMTPTYHEIVPKFENNQLVGWKGASGSENINDSGANYIIPKNKILIDQEAQQVYDYRNPSEDGKFGFTTHCFRERDGRNFGIIKNKCEEDFEMSGEKFEQHNKVINLKRNADNELATQSQQINKVNKTQP